MGTNLPPKNTDDVIYLETLNVEGGQIELKHIRRVKGVCFSVNPTKHTQMLEHC